MTELHLAENHAVTHPPGLTWQNFEMSEPVILGTTLRRWEGEDSNLRRQSRRFYRPLPLAARAPSRDATRIATPLIVANK
jgi:hypothetical protein